VERLQADDGAGGGPSQEALLLERARRGQVEALGELYERYVDRLYRHAYYFTRDRQQAEELTHQAFLRAWEEMGSGRWRRRRLLPRLLGLVHELAAAHLGQRGQGEAPVPGAGRRQDVLLALLGLPAPQRLVLTLRFVDGLGYQEIAAALGQTKEAVLLLQYRALSRLRRLLA
jgi:RNA polymerase sigma-70 factor (ECF subfamily)